MQIAATGARAWETDSPAFQVKRIEQANNSTGPTGRYITVYRFDIRETTQCLRCNSKLLLRIQWHGVSPNIKEHSEQHMGHNAYRLCCASDWRPWEEEDLHTLMGGSTFFPLLPTSKIDTYIMLLTTSTIPSCLS